MTTKRQRARKRPKPKGTPTQMRTLLIELVEHQRAAFEWRERVYKTLGLSLGGSRG